MKKKNKAVSVGWFRDEMAVNIKQQNIKKRVHKINNKANIIIIKENCINCN